MAKIVASLVLGALLVWLFVSTARYYATIRDPESKEHRELLRNAPKRLRLLRISLPITIFMIILVLFNLLTVLLLKS